MPSPFTTALILLAHGSPAPKASQELIALCDSLASGLTEPVLPAFLSVGSPNLPQALTQAGEIADQIRVLPLFLFSGKHLTEDIPALIKAYEAQPGHKKVELLPALGHHPKFLDWVSLSI